MRSPTLSGVMRYPDALFSSTRRMRARAVPISLGGIRVKRSITPLRHKPSTPAMNATTTRTRMMPANAMLFSVKVSSLRAQRSNPVCSIALDCFVAALLAMTMRGDHSPRRLAHRLQRFGPPMLPHLGLDLAEPAVVEDPGIAVGHPARGQRLDEPAGPRRHDAEPGRQHCRLVPR